MKSLIKKMVYICPECKAQYDFGIQAQKCQRSCIALNAAQNKERAKRKRIGDLVRLQVKKFEDIQPLLIETVKEVYGYNLHFNKFLDNKVVNVSCSHAAPIGCNTNGGEFRGPDPRYYKGYQKWIEGKMVSIKKSKKDISLTEIFGCWDYFGAVKYPLIGFHTGTWNGSGGLAGTGFSGDLYLFLQDFPYLWKNYLKTQLIEKL